MVTDMGTDSFVRSVHRLINDYVAVDMIEATNWIHEKTNKKVTAIELLGTWGTAENRLNLDQQAVLSCDSRLELSMPRKIINSRDSRLIHFKPRDVSDKSSDKIYQCIFFCNQENRRQVISLYRVTQPRDFSLEELSALRHLSHAILPAVRYHAQRKIQDPVAITMLR